jgi:hypothetical protein
VGLDAFCRHGQRLLGLDRHLASAPERLVEILCFPVCVLEAPMTRLPGYRVRRFLLQRQGACGRLHFLNGTATDITFVLGRDEPGVVEWIGLDRVPDGGDFWLDLAARPLGADSDRADGPPPADKLPASDQDSPPSPGSAPNRMNFSSVPAHGMDLFQDS